MIGLATWRISSSDMLSRVICLSCQCYRTPQVSPIQPRMMCGTSRSQKPKGDKRQEDGTGRCRSDSLSPIYCDTVAREAVVNHGGATMMHVLFIAISLLSASQVFAQEQSCGSQAMMTMTKADGAKLGLFISFAQISGSPPWTPEAGEPPLPLSKALQLATEWAKKEYKRFDGVQVRSINVTA